MNLKKYWFILQTGFLTLILVACGSKDIDFKQYIGQEKSQVFQHLSVSESVIECQYGIFKLPDKYSYRGFDFDIYLFEDTSLGNISEVIYANTDIGKSDFAKVKSTYENFVEDYGQPFNKEYTSQTLAMIESIDSMDSFDVEALTTPVLWSGWFIEKDRYEIRMELNLMDVSENGSVSLFLRVKSKM